MTLNMLESFKKSQSRQIADIFAILSNSFSTEEAMRYIVTLSFLRWLTELKHYSGKDPLTKNLQRKIKINLPDNLEFFVRLVCTEPISIGKDLNHVFLQLEELNPAELTGVFEGLDFSHPKFRVQKDSHNLLYEILTKVANVKLDNNESLTNLVEICLETASESMGSKFFAPEFNTPQSICSLITKLVQPKDGESIYDPVCGSGQLLIACAEAASDTGNENLDLAGTELNHSAWAIAKINAISHGYSSQELKFGDSLDASGVHTAFNEQRKFDVVVGHPPWGLKNNNFEKQHNDVYRRFEIGVPPRNNSDYAFILHMIASMKEHGGRAAIVVSNGTLSRSGQEGEIRKALIKKNLVDAVISLPEKLFQSTPISGAILVLSNSRQNTDILFIDTRSFATLGRGRNTLANEAIDKIAEIYIKRSIEDEVSSIASNETIENNDFLLSAPLYVRPIKEKTYRSIDEIHNERKATQARIDEISSEIEYLLQALLQK